LKEKGIVLTKINNYDNQSKMAATDLLASIIGNTYTSSVTKVSSYLVHQARKQSFEAKTTQQIKAEEKKGKARKRGGYVKPETEKLKKKIAEFLESIVNEYVFLVPKNKCNKLILTKKFQFLKLLYQKRLLHNCTTIT